MARPALVSNAGFRVTAVVVGDASDAGARVRIANALGAVVAGLAGARVIADMADAAAAVTAVSVRNALHADSRGLVADRAVVLGITAVEAVGTRHDRLARVRRAPLAITAVEVEEAVDACLCQLVAPPDLVASRSAGPARGVHHLAARPIGGGRRVGSAIRHRLRSEGLIARAAARRRCHDPRTDGHKKETPIHHPPPCSWAVRKRAQLPRRQGSVVWRGRRERRFPTGVSVARAGGGGQVWLCATREPANASV